jgi:hypothetical protein
MSWLEIALPGSLLFLKFLMKLFVDRNANFSDLMSAICNLPTDIVFMGASLLAGAMIASKVDIKTGLVLILGQFCTALVISFLARRSDKLFSADFYIRSAFLIILNLAVSLGTLIFVVNQITGAP